MTSKKWLLNLLVAVLFLAACNANKGTTSEKSAEAVEATAKAVNGAKDAAKATDASEATAKAVNETKETAKAAVPATKPAAEKGEMVQLDIGDKAVMLDYKMQDISGKEVSINDTKGENGVLLMFSCNTCPYVIGWEDRYNAVATACKEKNVGLLVINSNEAKRGGDDSMQAMKEHAAELDYQFLYVVDTNHQLADAIGAKKTPDLFLFDKDLKLAYKVALDDNMRNPNDVENFYIKTAVNNMAEGKPIDPATTKAVGCTIKRMKKL